MSTRILSAFFLFLYVSVFQAQETFFIKNNADKSEKIRFKLVNNLIIVPIEVNGTELSFLLDTGVSKPIVFIFEDINNILELNHAKRIYLRGLGNGEPIEAIKSENNVVKIGNAQSNEESLFVLNDESLSFTPRLGAPVHGVLGYSLFKDFVVEVNYSSKYIRLYKPESYKYKKCKKCETLPITIHNSKPYINSIVKLDAEELPVKLLVDTGGSDALWLFEDDSLGIGLGDRNYFDDFLGHGLSGSVYGKRSKVNAFKINSFELKKANVAFPDSVSIMATRLVSDRNGSISGNILKRFNIIFDYPNNKMTFKKNRHFKDKFSYNKSGIELEHNGVRLLQEEVYEYKSQIDDNSIESSSTRNAVKINFERRFRYAFKPVFTVVELREGSPAEKAGVMLGDMIVRINGKETHSMELQKVMEKFYGKKGDVIKLNIERDGKPMFIAFRLESLLE